MISHRMRRSRLCPSRCINAALQAKQKALKLGVIADDIGWTALLDTLGITVIKDGRDISKINNKIIEIEKMREQQSA